MFGNLFTRKPSPPKAPAHMLIAQLNCRLMPMDRGEYFADPLDEQLQAEGLGEVSGGGTMQARNGEIDYCDIEIMLNAVDAATTARVVDLLQAMGAPKGSKLHLEAGRGEIPFGTCEGLALYLNGTDLPDEVYRDCDSNHVYAELDRLVSPGGRVMSHWQGPTETALYLYGDSFERMRGAIEDFVSTYPLCRKARVEQIA